MEAAHIETPQKKRKIGLLGLCAVAVAGSTPMIFTIGAAFTAQGSASLYIMLATAIIAALAVPGFIELVLMYPNKVGGISAVVTDAFRPYNPIIGCLAGTFYWWSWFEGSSFAATAIGDVIKQLFPTLALSIPMLATLVILVCLLLSFRGMGLVTRLMIPFAFTGIAVCLLSGFIPIYTGSINWHNVFHTALTTTFGGTFGQFTSIMAGIFFLAYAVPAYETTLVYVGETKNPSKTVPRAMFFGTGLTFLYYFIIPAIWLGTLGLAPLKEAVAPISPLFAPFLLGPAAHVATAIFFISNAMVTCFEAMNNSPRALAQIADDGLIPAFFGWRTKLDVPWISILITGAAAIVIVWYNAPTWFLAAVSFEYVLCLVFASIAVWLLRRHAPDLPRLYRAPRGFIGLGLVAAFAWIVCTVFGFQQFGLPTIVASILFAFSGLILYFWRKISDRRKAKLPLIPRTLHFKLAGTMISVLVLDAIGYLIAVSYISKENVTLIVVLEDIFVVVALMTLTVGFTLPGTVANAAEEISEAAKQLVKGTLKDFSTAMVALGQGNLEEAHAKITITPVKINSRDEIGEMGHHFNIMQEEIKHAAIGLEGARKGLQKARDDLNEVNKHLEERVVERTEQLANANKELTKALDDLKIAQEKIIESEKFASLGGMVAGIAHEINTPIGISITAISYFNEELKRLRDLLEQNKVDATQFAQFIATFMEAGNTVQENLSRAAELITSFKQTSADNVAETCREINLATYLKEILTSLHPIIAKNQLTVELQCPENLVITTYPGILFQTITNLINNSIEHGYDHKPGGKISIEISAKEKQVIIIYADNGKGIPKDLRKQIFEPFYTTNRNKGGVGLGLFIIYNKITQVLKGTIECVDAKNPPGGACFIVSLPKTVGR